MDMKHKRTLWYPETWVMLTQIIAIFLSASFHECGVLALHSPHDARLEYLLTTGGKSLITDVVLLDSKDSLRHKRDVAPQRSTVELSPIIGDVSADVAANLTAEDFEDDSGDKANLNLTSASFIANFTTKVTQHKYYDVRTNRPDETLFNSHWLNIKELLKNTSVTGNLSHSQLSQSYRRAVSHMLRFKFPFYGHLTSNITIATGGFIYAGEHMHSWLAATQYIAPLMANFDTSLSTESEIGYADTGDKFVIQWTKMPLRSQEKAGNYTFQAILYENGDIKFLYKEVPTKINNISDTQHPRKVGLSDAYLIMHHFYTLSRRVIYEYHRVDLDVESITNFTVIEIKAMPVCITIKSCEECVNTTTESFNCSWCSGHSDKGAFCSDDLGLHRRRQDWLDNHCDTQAGNVYCPTPGKPDAPSAPASTTTDHGSGPDDIVPSRFATTPSVTHASPVEVSKHAVDSNEKSSGGIVAIILIFGILLAFGGWVAYAYYNPHTPSGQCLIRYRPTRWRWPGDHGDVRYTASVHM